MKLAREIERLAWVTEFGALYMAATGCKCADAMNLAECTARTMTDYRDSPRPLALMLAHIDAKPVQPSASEPREHQPANA